MVVDGTTQFLGSNGPSAKQAIEKARDLAEDSSPHFCRISWEIRARSQAHVEADASFRTLPRPDKADSLCGGCSEPRRIAGLQAAKTHGRRLTHVAVVQSLTKVGSVDKGKNFAQDVRIKLDPKTDHTNLRLIAFVQERGQGKVLGAALQTSRAVDRGSAPRSQSFDGR